MKYTTEQKRVIISNNTESIEQYTRLYMQKTIDNHYKYDIVESVINQEFELHESKMNKS